MPNNTSIPLNTTNTTEPNIQENTLQNFITAIIEKDLANNTYSNRVDDNQEKLPNIITRFPPEPNGYLHIGHAKSICLNFGIANNYKGRCNLRFDDTNPDKESVEFVENIKQAIEWLGFRQSGDSAHIYYASDYFDILYKFAKILIQQGKAYVDSQTPEEIKQNRGNLTKAGINSIYRNRSSEENLHLFEEMQAGKHAEGTQVLRAKIDMQSPNINMRDPIIYRIKYSTHHRSGDKWCIYPMYDYTHCISDALEYITHSLCTLEFEDHKPLYNWILQQLVESKALKNPLPKQYEFARLNLQYALTSKRKILQLIENKVVESWDDPRLATLAGIKRRGFSPQSIRLFCERIGVAKSDSWIDYSVLEQALRDDLDPKVPRLSAVLKPLKLIIDNMPEDYTEICKAPINPHNPEQGMREFSISKNLWIEQDDFMIEPSKGFFRLFVGNKIRLRYGFVIECIGYDTNSTGAIQAVHVNYFPDSKSGTPGSNNYKVKGNIHWIDAQTALKAEVNIFEHLFTDPEPDTFGKNFLELINKNSKHTLQAYIENSQISNLLQNEMQVQFERHGYFVKDIGSTDNNIVFNRITTLKDSKNK